MDEDHSHLSDSENLDLRKIFFGQSFGMVEEIQDLLLRLEADQEDAHALKAVRRHVHTLKGDSYSIGLSAVGDLCHRIEDILGEASLTAGGLERETFDLLIQAVDEVNNLLSEGEAGRKTSMPDDLAARIDSLLRHTIRGGASGVRDDCTEYERAQMAEAQREGMNLHRVEIDLDPRCVEKSVGIFMIFQRLSSIGTVIHMSPDLQSADIDNAGQVVAVLAAGMDAGSVKDAAGIAGITVGVTVADYNACDRGRTAVAAAQIARNQFLTVEVSRVDRIMNLVGELIISRSMIDQIGKEMLEGDLSIDNAARLLAANSLMERTVSDLQTGVMKMRMVPINHVFRKFPGMVRELSAEKGKRVRLEITGRETELDKGIVDALGEPLAHLVRNMVDHGIEPSAERAAAGKPEEGVLRLRAFHEASQIVIQVSDDGRGIDITRLKELAAARGFIAQSDADRMGEADAIDLIFLPGLSTAGAVSATSGRGVGMDAVKTAVEGLKGAIETVSRPGTGTSFTIRLPLTLAVIRALLFSAGGRSYALPISAVAEVLRVDGDDLGTVANIDTLVLREKVFSLVRLDALLGRPDQGQHWRFALILGAGGRQAGFLVDRILGQEELVVKAVDGRYSSSGLIAGASILGNGSVVLILDAAAVLRKSVEDRKRRMVTA